MLYHKVLITVFLIIFFNVISSETEQVENCDFPCKENDTQPICVMDLDEYCFITLPSECAMERLKCIFQKEYALYDATYCKLEGFKCPVFQEPPSDSKELISYNENPEENVEVILKTENISAENPEDIENVIDQLTVQDSIESDEENGDNGEML